MCGVFVICSVSWMACENNNVTSLPHAMLLVRCIFVFVWVRASVWMFWRALHLISTAAILIEFAATYRKAINFSFVRCKFSIFTLKNVWVTFIQLAVWNTLSHSLNTCTSLLLLFCFFFSVCLRLFSSNHFQIDCLISHRVHVYLHFKLHCLCRISCA